MTGRSALFGLLLAAISALASAEDVVVGTGANFDATITDTKFVLVEFYAPWCGHCKNLEPEYQKAATTLKHNSDVKLVKVDATVERALSEKYNVQGFPTLKWFREGKPSEYGGGRVHDDIVSWVRKKIGPPSKPLADQAAIDTFSSNGGDAVLVGLFPETSGDDFKAFEEAANEIQEIEVGHTSDPDVIAKHGNAKVIMVQKFDNKLAKMEGSDALTKEKVRAFAVANMLPLVMTFTKNTQAKIFSDTAPKRHVLALHEEGYKELADLQGELSRVSQDHRGEILFITVEKNADNEGVFNFFNVNDVKTPKVISIKQGGGGMKKYYYDGEVKSEAMKAWLKDVLDGTVSPDLKSEEEPDNNTGGVKVLVGKTFKKEVFESGKSAFVDFYAPWCGHCKSLEPEWNKLGDEFKRNDKVLIGKMDSTANEVEEVDVQGFPTIYFWKAGDKKGSKYDGGRTFSEMSKFLNTELAKVAPSETPAPEPTKEL